MNTLARVLAVYLALVLLDAVSGYKLFRKVVHSATGVYCKLTNRGWWEREQCTSTLFYSKWLWLVISVAMGSAAGYVTLQALKTGKF